MGWIHVAESNYPEAMMEEIFNSPFTILHSPLPSTHHPPPRFTTKSVIPWHLGPHLEFQHQNSTGEQQ